MLQRPADIEILKVSALGRGLVSITLLDGVERVARQEFACGENTPAARRYPEEARAEDDEGKEEPKEEDSLRVSSSSDEDCSRPNTGLPDR